MRLGPKPLSWISVSLTDSKANTLRTLNLLVWYHIMWTREQLDRQAGSRALASQPLPTWHQGALPMTGGLRGKLLSDHGAPASDPGLGVLAEEQHGGEQEGPARKAGIRVGWPQEPAMVFREF